MQARNDLGPTIQANEAQNILSRFRQYLIQACHYSGHFDTIQAQKIWIRSNTYTRFWSAYLTQAWHNSDLPQFTPIRNDSGRSRFRPISIQVKYAQFRPDFFQAPRLRPDMIQARYDSGPSIFRPSKHDSGLSWFRLGTFQAHLYSQKEILHILPNLTKSTLMWT